MAGAEPGPSTGSGATAQVASARNRRGNQSSSAWSGCSGRSADFWGDPGLARFIADHANDTYVAYYAPAEMGYVIRLGIPPPRNWFCAYTAWRRLRNAPGLIEASLVAAMRTGLTHAAKKRETDAAGANRPSRFRPARYRSER